jgi:MOSC domain-containing protein YiiM/ferredoxin-NADP reductase
MGSFANSTNPDTPIPEPTSILSLRTSKLKPFGSLTITSGIDKKPRTGRVYVSPLGLAEDEHDLTFHGGIDKAIHQYCCDHYPLWQSMFQDPETKARFIPGGFGENIVAKGWNETNICIGDKVRIGLKGTSLTGGENGVLLEVSLPRQPCFKLNQRFGIKNFAPRTHQLARTGWYYRVIEEGWLEEGMEIRIVERPWPKWTIERLHFYVHKSKEDRDAMAELVGIKPMGMECRGVFEKRLEKIRKDEGKKKAEVWRDFKVVEKRRETSRTVAIILEPVERSLDIIGVPPGSHVRIKFPNGLARAYSVVEGTTDKLELGIARRENSRGGSAYVHDVLKVGHILSVGRVVTGTEIASMASHHVLLAGGIGITAFLAIVKSLTKYNFGYELHYAVRTNEDVAFAVCLRDLGVKVTLYDKSKGQRMNIPDIIKNRKWNSHVYICGPQGMMDEVMRESKASGMADDEVHYEAFQSDTSGDPFTAKVAQSGQKLEIGEQETLSEALRKVGLEVGSSCEVGNCGTCKVAVRSGKVEHRGTALSEQEKENQMLSCVSRGRGHIVIDLLDE